MEGWNGPTNASKDVHQIQKNRKCKTFFRPKKIKAQKFDNIFGLNPIGNMNDF